MRIDVHAHLYPAEYLRMLERFGGRPAEAFMRDLRGGSTPPEMAERLTLMDADGVDLQVLSVSSSAPNLVNREQAADAARCANDAFAEAIARYPGRFAGFAALPLPDVDAAIAELGRALDELGFVGATTTTEVLGVSIADHHFDPLFAELDRRQAVLFVHPAGTGLHAPAIERARFTWSIGAPFEDMLCLLQLAQAQVPARFPHVKIISAHLGGCASFLTERLGHHNVLPASRGAQPPALSTPDAAWFFYDTVNGHPPAVKCAADSVGSECLLFGTDFPYNRGANHRQMITSIAQAGLAADAVDAIGGGNARCLFGSRMPTPLASIG